jgi:hypothetical protein
VAETGKFSVGVTFNTPMRKPCFLIGGQPNSLSGIFTVRQKPPFMRNQLMASASDFNSKRGFMVRSEGGRICCSINRLERFIKP